MSLLLATLLASTAVTPVIAREDIVVFEAGGLVAPCREEAEAHFAGQGLPTYQWTASHKSRGNLLLVDGTLRVDGEDMEVACRLSRGARLRYMTLEISAR